MTARDDYPLNMNDPLNRRVLDELDRLRAHVRSLHHLNGWSKVKGWWCSCGAKVVPRSLADRNDPRPWTPEGRHAAEIQHAFHVGRALQTDDQATAIEDALDRATCTTCRGTRTVQPDYYSPPEPCPKCVDEDEFA